MKRLLALILLTLLLGGCGRYRAETDPQRVKRINDLQLCQSRDWWEIRRDQAQARVSVAKQRRGYQVNAGRRSGTFAKGDLVAAEESLSRIDAEIELRGVDCNLRE